MSRGRNNGWGKCGSANGFQQCRSEAIEVSCPTSSSTLVPWLNVLQGVERRFDNRGCVSARVRSTQGRHAVDQLGSPLQVCMRPWWCDEHMLTTFLLWLYMQHVQLRSMSSGACSLIQAKAKPTPEALQGKLVRTSSDSCLLLERAQNELGGYLQFTRQSRQRPFSTSWRPYISPAKAASVLSAQVGGLTYQVLCMARSITYPRLP